MLRTKFHQFQPLFELNIISSSLLATFLLVRLLLYLLRLSVQFEVFFLDFSRRRPPPVSDHFVVHQDWSLTRELSVLVFIRKQTNELCDMKRGYSKRPY